MGNHPIDAERQKRLASVLNDPKPATPTHAVFRALLDAIPSMSDWTQSDREEWEARYRDALDVERQHQDLNRSWDGSLRTVGRGGQ